MESLKPCPFCGGEAMYDPFEVKTPYSTKFVDAVVKQPTAIAAERKDDEQID